MLGLRKALRKTDSSQPPITASPVQEDILHSSCYRRLVESASGHALFLLDPDSRIRSWSQGAFEIFGYTQSEVLGQPLKMLIPGTAKVEFDYDETLWRARQAGAAGWESARPILSRDGRDVPALVKVTAFFDAAFNAIAYGVSVRPDEPAILERDYLDSLALLGTIVEALHDPIFLKDRHGRYLLVNPAFAEFACVAADGILGKTDSELFPPEVCADALRSDQAVLNTEKVEEYEYSVGQGTTHRIMQVTKLPFYNAAGGVSGVFGLMRDATSRRLEELERECLLAGEQTARQAAERTVRQLHAIQSVSEVSMMDLDSPALMAELLDRIMQALHSDVATICLLSDDKKQLIHCLSRGAFSEIDTTERHLVGQGLIGDIASQNQAIVVADRHRHEVGHLFNNQEMRAFIGSPLVHNGQMLGVLHIGSRVVGQFSEEDLQILSHVAGRVVSAIERSRLFDELNAANFAMHQLSHRMLEVQEEERRHIARELHDEIGQMLTGIKLHLQNTPSSSSAAAFAAHAETSAQYVDDAIAEIRRLSAGLRPPALDVLGLEAALRECAERMATQAGIQHKVSAENVGRFSHDLEIVLFRIAQESITNVVRHARAKSVCIAVQRRRSTVTLKISDDGIGFDYQAIKEQIETGRSYGLRGIQERAVLMNGTLAIKSRPGKGTIIKVTFGINTNAAS